MNTINKIKVGNIDYDIEASGSNVTSGQATQGQVLTADGSGGASWQNGGGGITVPTITIADSQLTEIEEGMWNVAWTSEQIATCSNADNVFVKFVNVTNNIDVVLPRIMNDDGYLLFMSGAIMRTYATALFYCVNVCEDDGLMSVFFENIQTALPDQEGEEGKYLHVDSEGDLEWATVSGGQTYTAGKGISIVNNVISEKYAETIEIQESQIVSESPLTIQLTDDQAAILEDEFTTKVYIDASDLGMPLSLLHRQSEDTFSIDASEIYHSTGNVDSYFGIVWYNQTLKQIVIGVNELLTEVPTASTTTLGGVKVGNGLSIDANGVLSVSLTNANTQSF